MRRQLSRLELAIAMLVLAVLVLVFLHFVRGVQQRAESAQVSATIANLTAHLNIVAFHYLIRNDLQQLAAMDGANPLRGLESGADRHSIPKVSTPDGRYRSQVAPVSVAYLGEQVGSSSRTVSPGSWVFDPSDACLVYYLRHAESFHSELPGAARIRLQVKLVFDDNNGDNRFDEGDQFSHVALVPLDSYQWQ